MRLSAPPRQSRAPVPTTRPSPTSRLVTTALYRPGHGWVRPPAALLPGCLRPAPAPHSSPSPALPARTRTVASASSDDAFDLPTAVLLAKAAFEAYSDPKGTGAFTERGLSGDSVIYLDREYLARNFEGMLRVDVRRGKALLAADPWGKSDPYVDLTVGLSGARTGVKFLTLEPEWNETHLLYVRRRDQQKLTIKVMDKDQITADDLIGTAVLPLAPLCAPPEALKADWNPATMLARFLEGMFKENKADDVSPVWMADARAHAPECFPESALREYKKSLPSHQSPHSPSQTPTAPGTPACPQVPPSPGLLVTSGPHAPHRSPGGPQGRGRRHPRAGRALLPLHRGGQGRGDGRL